MTKTKITDRGYWVAQLFYYQSVMYGFLFSIRFLSPTFFSAINPGLSFGGMFDDRKSDSYNLLPDQLLPKTKLIENTDNSINEILSSGFNFPLILKPDIGFKGFLVSKVDDQAQLTATLPKFEQRAVLVQEYISFVKEYSILIYRYPKSNEIGVSSFIEKTYPKVVGDGKQTLEALIDAAENPFLKKDWIKNKLADSLSQILPLGEEKQIDDIGNYSRGAAFHSYNHLIDEAVLDWANRFMTQIQGIDFCRADLKADSIEGLLNDDFLLIEVNGAKSEPLHIYDSRFSYLEIVKDIHMHWKIVKRIVKQRLAMSYQLPPFMEGFRSWWIAHNLVK